jgi:dipeptidyl aminopeptidase/acylaminoacyl peptidase
MLAYKTSEKKNLTPAHGNRRSALVRGAQIENRDSEDFWSPPSTSMTTLLLFSILFMLILASCSGEGLLQTTIPLQISTVTPSPSYLKTNRVSSTATGTQSISFPNSKPTQTHSIFSTAVISTPTITHSPTSHRISSSPTATNPPEELNALSTLEVLLPGFRRRQFSPNQAWVVGWRNDDTWVVSSDLSSKWVISYGKYYGEKHSSGDGYIVPIHWTQNEKYLYLTIQCPCSGPIYFDYNQGLVRLDLATGRLAEALPSPGHSGYSISFSPNGDYLAYIYQGHEPLFVSIVNMMNGEIESLKLSERYNQAGMINWSPDGSRIILAQAIVDYMGDSGFLDLFSLAVINLRYGSVQDIVMDSKQILYPLTWISEDEVEIKDGEGKRWILDTKDNSFREK